MAETYHYVGPGNNAVETIVRIDGGGDTTKQPSEVLAVADGGKYLGLTMKWLTSTHLLIILKDDPVLVNYQVVKTSGIDVSLRYDKSQIR